MRLSQKKWALIAVAAAVLTVSQAVYAQAPANNKALVVGRNSRFYVVDFTSGTATALPSNFAADKAAFPSPDLSHMITSDSNAIVVYKIVGGALQMVKTITGQGLSSIAWAPDSMSFVYALNIEHPDGSVSVEIHQWNLTSAEGRRLL